MCVRGTESEIYKHYCLFVVFFHISRTYKTLTIHLISVYDHGRFVLFRTLYIFGSRIIVSYSIELLCLVVGQVMYCILNCCIV